MAVCLFSIVAASTDAGTLTLTLEKDVVVMSTRPLSPLKFPSRGVFTRRCEPAMSGVLNLEKAPAPWMCARPTASDARKEECSTGPPPPEKLLRCARGLRPLTKLLCSDGGLRGESNWMPDMTCRATRPDTVRRRL